MVTPPKPPKHWELPRTLALAVKFNLKDSQLADYDGPSHPGHGKLCEPSSFAQVGSWMGGDQKLRKMRGVLGEDIFLVKKRCFVCQDVIIT